MDSSLGTIMCITGIVMGLIRYRRKDKSSLVFSPYKKKWFRWHHYAGFVFGIFAFTWVLSGLLSMTPWDWAPFTRLNTEENEKWIGNDTDGGSVNPYLFEVSPSKAAELFSKEIPVKEIHLQQFDGKPYYLGYQDDLNTILMFASVPSLKTFKVFGEKDFIQKIKELNGKANISEAMKLSEYDDYYYSKNGEKRLPVLRVKTETPEETWYYVDLKTGQVVLKHEKLSRLERWLYHGLHSFDFSFLINRRPLWDIIMIILMLGGTLATGTGLVLALKWFGRKQLKLFVK